MYRACGRCGKIHDTRFKCDVSRVYVPTDESRLRSKYSWTKKSEEIRERANYLCEVCRDQGQITYDNIEVHHIIKLKDDSSKLLDNYNLICLCQEHHKQADDGQIETGYLFELAMKRENSHTEKI